MTMPAPAPTWRGIPRGVWALGLVSLFMDLSSEMIHAVLPLYLVTVLGSSVLTVGVIEGIAEATAAITKVFSGALSDRLGTRKPLAVLGYGLAACAKPIFPLAGSIGWIIAARFIDRVGKGIRGAPRDALIADLAPAAVRGASFGLRQTLDSVGAFLAPLVALALMLLSGDDFSLVFWVAVVPAILSVAVLVAGVREASRRDADRPRPVPLSRRAVRSLGSPFWVVVAIAGVFTLARFSEAFLLLRAQSVGVPLAWVPLVMVLMNIVYALAAWPAGTLSDSFGRFRILVAGFVLLLAADLLLAFAGGVLLLGLGVALWGLHMGLTQGILSSLVADTAPPALRGTAFGVYNLVSGVALLAASLIAGGLWDVVGPSGTFLAGAAVTAVALAALPLMPRSVERDGPP